MEIESAFALERILGFERIFGFESAWILKAPTQKSTQDYESPEIRPLYSIAHKSQRENVER